MNSNDKGVALSGPELRALLEFASKEETDRNKYGVQITIEGTRVWARATNGDVALELDGESDGKHADGEWFVHRHFLVQGRKLITGKQVLRLAFSGASLNSAIVEENSVEICTIEVPSDAAVSQASFPAVDKVVKLPARARTVAHCSALAGAHAGLIELIEAAVGVEVSDFYPPKDADSLWVVVAGDGGQTVAKASLTPRKSAAATREEGEDSDGDEDEKPKRGRKKASRQQELAT